MNKAQKLLVKKAMQIASATGVSMVIAMQQAYAALPAGIQTAIDEAQADGSTLGYALMAMAITVGLIFWVKSRASK